MRPIILVLSLLFAGVSPVASQTVPAGPPPLSEAGKVAQYLQEISVTIKAGGSEGSGVLVTRKVGEEEFSFVWTAAHVIDGLRSTRTVIDPRSGTPRTIVEFKDPEILREIVAGGKRVGEVLMATRVVRFSDADTGHDLALLMVRKSDYNKASARFYLDKEIPPIGTRLFHVGSLLGTSGANSMTAGIISQIGRLIAITKFEYDQTSVTAFPGSSGGGVYLEDGRYIGMLVRGSGEQFNLIVPVRRMVAWAKENNILWAIDPNEPMPSAKDLEALAVEDIGVKFAYDAAKQAASALSPKTPGIIGPLLPPVAPDEVDGNILLPPAPLDPIFPNVPPLVPESVDGNEEFPHLLKRAGTVKFGLLLKRR